jgi:hypothetical protein
MSDTGKFVSPVDMVAMERSGIGKIEYDDQGNAVFVPFKALTSADALSRLLNDPTLALSEEARSAIGRLQPNPQGVVKGYDPYDSGMLNKDKRKQKKDLRALSKWITAKKQPPEGG